MSLKLDFPPVREVRITLDVNDRSFDLSVEPRAILADVLREQCGLTATHIGCEHGVCGACTVMVDGAPQRSCLQSAARFEGKHVETLEAFAEDALMAQLRQAFTAEHALQCGYCTPGMLITARDIALRLPEADEARIREELAGNLCRCTGYNGIVAAIQRVLREHARERAALKTSHAA